MVRFRVMITKARVEKLFELSKVLKERADWGVYATIRMDLKEVVNQLRRGDYTREKALNALNELDDVVGLSSNKRDRNRAYTMFGSSLTAVIQSLSTDEERGEAACD